MYQDRFYFVISGGSCSLPVTLQGTEIPIISDDECSGIYGDDFQPDNMICVWGGDGGGIGSCNVSC